MNSSRPEDNSVTQWLAGLKAGDAEAVRQLWNRYSAALIGQARQRLNHAPRQAADEEDVAQSVFVSLCRGAADGRFDDLANRDDLWWLLLALTRHKAAGQIRRDAAQKRGGLNRTKTFSQLKDQDGDSHFSFELLISDEPTPEDLAIMAEEYNHLLTLLRDDQLRKVASLRIEGYSVAELSQQVGIGVRSIERKLRLIRTTWAKHLASLTLSQ